MKWLEFLAPVIRVLAALAKLFAARTQRRLGRLEAENAQAVRDRKMLRKAADARRAVRDDAERVRNDPRNRDAR